MASRCLSFCKIYLFSFLVWHSHLVVCGDIIVSPGDTETSTGETTELYCTSTVGAIEWHHLRPGADVPDFVYKNGYIYSGYKDRFDAGNCKGAAGKCNLVIHNVSLEDSGTYTCMEKSEETVQKPAQLIVFEQYPSVQSCVTRITCSPECDALELSCKMKYSANIDALMEWRDSAEKLLPSATIAINSTKTSTVHLHKDPSQSQSSYTCQVIYPASSLGSRYNWTHRPQDLLASNAAQESSNQTVTALTASLVIAVVLLSGIIVFISWKLKSSRRETELRRKGRPIAGNSQMQLAGDKQQLINHHTPLVNRGSIDGRTWCQCRQQPGKRRRTMSS